MKNELNLFNNSIMGINKDALSQEIMTCNNITKEYGLKLNYDDAVEIAEERNNALLKNGRIEFNGQIINMIINKFCDSPFISQYNYKDTICTLVDIFYEYKNESDDIISDEDLINFMCDKFNNECSGSLELLEGKYLYEEADKARKSSLNSIDSDEEENYYE